MDRLRDFEAEGRRHAIPVLTFQGLEGGSICDIRKKFYDFVPPRSYYIIDKNPEILGYCNGIKKVGSEIKHTNRNIESTEVCIY